MGPSPGANDTVDALGRQSARFLLTLMNRFRSVHLGSVGSAGTGAAQWRSGSQRACYRATEPTFTEACVISPGEHRFTQ